MIRRWALLAVVALGLAPGTFVRTPTPTPDMTAGITVTRLTGLPGQIGPFKVLNAWQLESDNSLFDSYSALRPLGEGRYLAVSDRGHALRFTIAEDRMTGARVEEIPQIKGYGDKVFSDIEALAVDLANDNLWFAYEGLNAIERRAGDFADPVRIRPAAMAQWLENSGPEAMARLADGSFIVIGEGTRKWRGERLPAVLFAGDPVEEAPATEFAFTAPDGLRPTDIATLPDGRVLVLLRGLVWSLPPGFEIGLMVADPADIKAGETWTGELLATFTRPFPTDNYEGLSVESDGGYPVTITLISDDNGMSYQRTLVAQLQWDGAGSE